MIELEDRSTEALQRPKSVLEMLATLLQTPKRFFFACKIVANAKNYFFSFARLLQAPKTTFSHLQDCCKRQNVFFSLARLLQAPKLHFSICKSLADNFMSSFGHFSALAKTLPSREKA